MICQHRITRSNPRKETPVTQPKTQDYIGTKRITAWEATSPHDVVVGQARETGYAVKYADGYTSWSPKAVFEAAYQPLTAMNFGHAMAAMKDGHEVARAGWKAPERAALMVIPNEGVGFARFGYHHSKKWLTGWMPSEDDLMADDWTVVGEAKPE